MKYPHTKNEFSKARYAKLEDATVAMYDTVPSEIKCNVFKAHRWAKDFLMRREGSGHHFCLHREKNGLISCSFAKPEWAGDHGGMEMPTGAEAIVRAVCEYVHGY
ncbi:hypothetical protein CC53_gp162 [Rhizobium phage vB_RleS_L338C]|uniref:hypothetical protein n=1 Tax=Rhizobium phage vB_RleS_L338C TaxID=1414737 RepID=UPI0003D88AD6|nr:hypothetical protein CC53_gp162 [Rhizobium phage vB_RleS_L338C]AHC30579.1 hypothetical protein L338C_162 [Rhizobium phage vB_RleS_L338C]QNH72143.1 hypothetical protein P11VFA_157 [Rhizobium phage P11VFA]